MLNGVDVSRQMQNLKAEGLNAADSEACWVMMEAVYQFSKRSGNPAGKRQTLTRNSP
jgi:hypothetical protein